MNETTTIRRGRIYLLAMTAVMTAVTCVLAPMAIPIGPVPISLTNLVIYISLYLLGWKLATVSYLVYILIGIVGMPVFSGFMGGLGKVAGPTGGYIVGFLPMAVIAGLCISRSGSRIVHLLGMIAGTAVCYAFGTAWYCFISGTGWIPALSTCVFPFLPFDLIKMIVTLSFGPVVRGRLVAAGIRLEG